MIILHVRAAHYLRILYVCVWWVPPPPTPSTRPLEPKLEKECRAFGNVYIYIYIQAYARVETLIFVFTAHIILYHIVYYNIIITYVVGQCARLKIITTIIRITEVNSFECKRSYSIVRQVVTVRPRAYNMVYIPPYNPGRRLIESDHAVIKHDVIVLRTGEKTIRTCALTKEINDYYEILRGSSRPGHYIYIL